MAHLMKAVLILLLCLPVGAQTCPVTAPASGATVNGIVTWTASLSGMPGGSADWVYDDIWVIGHVPVAQGATSVSLVNYNTGWDLDGPGNVKVIVRDATGAAICTSADVPFTTSNCSLNQSNAACNMGITLASGGGFTSSFTNIPTVSGAMKVDINGNYGAPGAGGDIINSQDTIDGMTGIGIKTSPGAASYPTGSSYRLTYDSTKLVNGIHAFSWTTFCSNSSTNCGSPANAQISGVNIPRAFVGGMFNSQNGHTLIGPVPDAIYLNMVVGGAACSLGNINPAGCGTYQLTAKLHYTDQADTACSMDATHCIVVRGGAGAATSPTDNACLYANAAEPELPFQCITGNTHATLNTSEGADYVLVSSSGLITAVSQGASYIVLADQVSGKVSPTPLLVTVKALATVPHFGICGAVYNTYHAGGACPSFLLTSLFNSDALTNAAFQTLLTQSGYTAAEIHFHQQPQGFSNFSTWKATWQNNYGSNVTTALSNMPGMALVLRGEEAFGVKQDLIEVEQGPSASWSPSSCGGGSCAGATDPLDYELQQLSATGRVALSAPRDESESPYGYAGFNLNPSIDMVPQDGSTKGTDSITISGCPSACQATFHTQGQYNFYPGWARLDGNGAGNHGDSVTITAATNTSLNGEWETCSNCLTFNSTTIGGYYCTQWNAILQFNGANTRDGDCASNPSHFNTWVARPSTNTGATAACNSSGTCTNGTYTFAGGGGNIAEPTAKIAAWGKGPCPDCATGYAGQQMKNDNWTFAVAKFKAVGIATAWNTSAAADFTTDFGFQGQPSLRDAFSRYMTYTGGIMPASSVPWGRTYFENYYHDTVSMPGWYTFSGTATGTTPSLTCCQWRADSGSYATQSQDIPLILLAAFGAETFNLGGRNLTVSGSIAGCAPSTCTTDGTTGVVNFTTPHGITLGSNVPFNVIKVILYGNSDSTISCANAAGSNPTAKVSCSAGRWSAVPAGTSSLRLFRSSTGCTQGSGALGNLVIPSMSITDPIVNPGGAYAQLVLQNTLPTNIPVGTIVQISGAGGSNAACNGTYVFMSYPVNASGVTVYSQVNLGMMITSTGTGGTALVNDDQGQYNPLYDVNKFGNGRFGAGGSASNLMFLAGSGVAGIRAYQGSSAVANGPLWGAQWPNNQDILGMQSIALGEPNQTLNQQQRWWDNAQGLNLLKRLTPFYLQTMGAAPYISPGPPWVVTTLQTSAAYGTLLQVISFSEAPIPITVPVGSVCQIGSNPISVYRVSVPHATTELLIGTQTNYSTTLDPGEGIAFVCHNSATSFVQPYNISFTPPGGTVKIVATAVFGNYAGPLAQYFGTNSTGTEAFRATTCANSPCAINIDKNVSDVYFDLAFLDATNAVISTAGPFHIPAGPGTPGGTTVAGTCRGCAIH